MNQEELDKLLGKLKKAVRRERASSTCLNLWSKFVRARDGYKCVLCSSKNRISAHHIVRKSFLKEAMYMTGNGITLCKTCHQEVHSGFNGRPDLEQPMDAQEGEKLEVVTMLYQELSRNGRRHWGLKDDYYFLSEQVLCKFKIFQSYDPFEYFPGFGCEQASIIWSASVVCLKNAILEANGLYPTREASLPGIQVYLKK